MRSKTSCDYVWLRVSFSCQKVGAWRSCAKTCQTWTNCFLFETNRDSLLPMDFQLGLLLEPHEKLDYSCEIVPWNTYWQKTYPGLLSGAWQILDTLIKEVDSTMPDTRWLLIHDYKCLLKRINDMCTTLWSRRAKHMVISTILPQPIAEEILEQLEAEGYCLGCVCRRFFRYFYVSSLYL